MSHSLNIFECKSSACRVDLLICINSSYSVETVAQPKDSPCNAITVGFIKKFTFVYRQNKNKTINSVKTKPIKL